MKSQRSSAMGLIMTLSVLSMACSSHRSSSTAERTSQFSNPEQTNTISQEGAEAVDQKRGFSREAAIAIAEKAVTDKIEVRLNSTPLVENREVIVVTFPLELPPNTLGPDYAAQVTIDADSGRVIKVLAGS